jgi:hypothetical protein
MIGRVMDPYLTLGLPKACNRDELKEAFRARIQHAHPDRGGEDESFIRLRTAYEQILAELDQELDARAARAPRDASRPVPPGSRVVGDTYESWFRHIAVEADRSHSGWRSPRIRTIGMMILLGIIVVNLTAFLIVWAPAPDGSLPSADSPVEPAAGLAEPDAVTAPIRLATLPLADRRWQQRPAHLPDFFVIPYDAILYIAPVEGHRGETSEFGIVTSQGDVIPIFTGLPSRPKPAGEIEIGPVSAGSRLRIYLKKNGSWVFSDAAFSKPSIESFSDRDHSLGGGGSIIERTSPATWVLHLDDVGSTDDDDEDVFIQIRLGPIQD